MGGIRLFVQAMIHPRLKLSTGGSQKGLLLVGLITLLLIVSQRLTIFAQELPEGLEAIVSGVRINLFEGGVVGERNQKLLAVSAGMVLEDHDVIRTDKTGRAEILLQPGNYLRIDSDTQFSLQSDQYDQMRIKLESGSVTFETLGNEWEVPGYFNNLSNGYDLIRVITPRGEVFVTPASICRINITKEGATEVFVRKGEAFLNGQLVKAKKGALESNGSITINDRNPKIEDNFDSWCRERAQQLVEANRTLKKDAPWQKNRKEGKEPIVDIPANDEKNSSSPYIVSARPGKVSLVESGVEYLRKKPEWENLTLDTELKSQDKVRTDQYGRAELMMFPDIYLRLDVSSELLLEELSNDAVTLRLLRGSMILDVAIFDRKRLPTISFGGPSGIAVVDDDGNFRVNAGQGKDQIVVREGKVSFSGHSIGGCRRISNGSQTECEKKRNDSFDLWSQSRGEGVTFYGRSMVGSVAKVRKRRAKSTGFWYRPQSVSFYTFVPYSLTSFRSPYGGSYSVALSPRGTPMLVPFPRTRDSFRFPRGAQ